MSTKTQPPKTVTKPVVVPDMIDADYHAHEGSLSASGAKWLAPPHSCPAKFKWRRENPETKAVFDFGHAAHRLVLGKGADIEILPYDSFRSAAAKEAEDQARAAKKVPLLQKDWERAKAVAAAVKDDPMAGALFSEGDAETSLFWPDEETGVVRRARFDWLTPVEAHRRRFIVDLKTARTAEPDGFGKSAADFGYALSAANYVDGAIACGLADDPAFLLVAVEKEEPFVVTTFQVPDDLLELGRRLMSQALRTYADCTARDHWPGYSEGIEQLQLPGYYVNRIEDLIA